MLDLEPRAAAGESPKNQATTPRRLDIDGLRAVAISLVLVFHAAPTWLPAGFIGVDVFFVISGYLITQILIEDSAPGCWRRFYGRRLRRLAPALAVVLAAVLILSSWLLLPTERGHLSTHVIASIAFVANLVFWSETGYFDAAAATKPLLHLWSLGVEEQFYLIWPLILWWVLRSRKSRLVGALMLLVLSFGAAVIVAPRAPGDVFFLPHFRFWEFLFGACLVLRPGGQQSKAMSPRSWPFELAAAGAIAAIVLPARLIDPNQPFPSWNALPAVAATAWLCWAGAGTFVGRCLSWRWVVWLGVISYPLYLWHWPLLSILGQVTELDSAGRLILLALATALAALTYRFVEMPIQAIYRLRPAPTVVCLCAALAFLAALGALTQGNSQTERFQPSAQHQFVQDQLDLDQSLREALLGRPCALPSFAPEAARETCMIDDRTGSSETVVLWGDSAGVSWGPLVRTWAHSRSANSVVISFSACPPIFGIRTPIHPLCELEDSHWKLDWLKSLRPSLIVITARWGAYVEPTPIKTYSQPHFVTLDQGFPNQESSRAAVREQLPKTLATLAAVAPVLVILAAPDLVNDPHRCLPRGIEFRQPLSDHLATQALVRELVLVSATENHRIGFLDPTPRFCPGSLCEAVIDGVLAYQDDNHVSASGALLFSEDFNQLAGALLEAARRPGS